MVKFKFILWGGVSFEILRDRKFWIIGSVYLLIEEMKNGSCVEGNDFVNMCRLDIFYYRY